MWENRGFDQAYEMPGRGREGPRSGQTKGTATKELTESCHPGVRTGQGTNMPDKKELAGSAKNGVAQNHNISCGDRNDPAHNVIAEFIEHIEEVLAAVDFAGAPDAPATDMLRPCADVAPMESCHASISCVSRHRAISLNLYWNGARPTARPDAADSDERLRQLEAVKIEFAGSAM